jgi:hypothetical protein
MLVAGMMVAGGGCQASTSIETDAVNVAPSDGITHFNPAGPEQGTLVPLYQGACPIRMTTTGPVPRTTDATLWFTNVNGTSARARVYGRPSVVRASTAIAEYIVGARSSLTLPADSNRPFFSPANIANTPPGVQTQPIYWTNNGCSGLRKQADRMRALVAAGPVSEAAHLGKGPMLKNIVNEAPSDVCGVNVHGFRFEVWSDSAGVATPTDDLANAMIACYGAEITSFAFMAGSSFGGGTPFSTLVIDPEPAKLTQALNGTTASAGATSLGTITGDTNRRFFYAPRTGSISSSAPVGSPCVDTFPFEDTTVEITNVLVQPLTSSGNPMFGKRRCAFKGDTLYPVDKTVP